MNSLSTTFHARRQRRMLVRDYTQVYPTNWSRCIHRPEHLVNADMNICLPNRFFFKLITDVPDVFQQLCIDIFRRASLLHPGTDTSKELNNYPCIPLQKKIN